MPKKKEEISPEDQSRRFLDAAQKLVDAGELDPAEAEKALDRIVRSSRSLRQLRSSDES
jgi:hypothetical protein